MVMGFYLRDIGPFFLFQDLFDIAHPEYLKVDHGFRKGVKPVYHLGNEYIPIIQGR